MNLEPTIDWPVGYFKGMENLPESKYFGFDIETKGLTPYRKDVYIVSFAVSAKEGTANCCIVNHQGNLASSEDLFKLFKVLGDPNNIVIGHNVKFDINWIRVKFGIEIKCRLFDTLFGMYLLNENMLDNSLGTLASGFEDIQGHKNLVNRKNIELSSEQDLLVYNGKDADAVRRLFPLMGVALKKQGMLPLMSVAMQTIPVLSKIETIGIYLDKQYAAQTQKKMFDQLVAAKYKLRELCGIGFEPGSAKNMRHYLYTELELPIRKYTESGLPSTDVEALKRAKLDLTSQEDHDFIDTALVWSKSVKLLSTYYDPIERWTTYDGRVHTTYSLGKSREQRTESGTVTGRLGSSDPNLQNIPRGTGHRGMFAATPEYTFIDGDFSQLELRVAAYLAQEPVMVEAFKNGQDIHTAVMSDMRQVPYKDMVQMLDDESLPNYQELKNDRSAIKRINFGILYGVSPPRLQNVIWMELGIDWELERCERLIADWLSKYKAIERWIKVQRNLAVNQRFVSMPFGQRRRLPEANWKTPEGRRALRQATNFPVQSTASWICLIGMNLLDNYFNHLTKQGIDARILLQVHDSISGEVKTKDETVLKTIRDDVQRILEVDTVSFIKDAFNVNFDVPLSFPVATAERWS